MHNLCQLKVHSGGVLWKKQGGGKAVEVDKSDISALTWMKVPRTNQLCIRTKDGLKYKFTGYLTVRNDVYSFGVVLLELLTGRRSVDKMRPTKEQSLVDWARPKLKDNKKWLLFINPRLEDQYSVRAAQKACSLAYYCLSNNHKARPLTTGIVETLEHLQGNYIGDAAITFISPLTGRGSVSVGYTEYQSGRWLDSQGQNTSVVHEAVVAQYMMMVAGVSVLESRGVGFFEENQILLMFKDICNAVFAMHSTKAENLLLGSDRLWKLCDFGSTSTNHKRFERPEEMGIKEDTITNHKTLAYRSPKMWDLVLREVISEKVDIWALGIAKVRPIHPNDMLQSSPDSRPDITQARDLLD
ncbi:AP2-associated protein kinase 1 isoform X1 [Tanacetum coccineum]|uniref:non-specific serine/threonine protein kinase n=1 Tax=Tanacetum coccineum TaxID=301880 RepID=A0ABQ5A0J7_9ASTR